MQATRIAFVPSKLPYWTRDPKSKRWSYASGRFADWPIFGISQLVALEYAAWRTRTDKSGWRYRLPSDVEWEKAARGVDRREFVWGSYMVPSFAWCLNGIHRGLQIPDRVGVSPLDESVYGVRDLSGSVSEFTTGRTLVGRRFVSQRGGNWNSPDNYFCRAANRNGLLPESADRGCGFRLVAERVDDSATSGNDDR